MIIFEPGTIFEMPKLKFYAKLPFQLPMLLLYQKINIGAVVQFKQCCCDSFIVI